MMIFGQFMIVRVGLLHFFNISSSFTCTLLFKHLFSFLMYYLSSEIKEDSYRLTIG